MTHGPGWSLCRSWLLICLAYIDLKKDNMNLWIGINNQYYREAATRQQIYLLDYQSEVKWECIVSVLMLRLRLSSVFRTDFIWVVLIAGRNGVGTAHGNWELRLRLRLTSVFRTQRLRLSSVFRTQLVGVMITGRKVRVWTDGNWELRLQSTFTNGVIHFLEYLN